MSKRHRREQRRQQELQRREQARRQQEAAPPKEAPAALPLEEIERDLIQLAIEVYAGHMSEVARRLGIGRSTLYRKVREQGLEQLVKGGETDEEAAA